MRSGSRICIGTPQRGQGSPSPGITIGFRLFMSLDFRRNATIWLEPISKSSEEDNEAGKLDEAEEVVGDVIFPADEDAT